MIFLLLGCPPKVNVEETVQPEKKEQSIFQDEQRLHSGTYIHGVFRDKSFPLEGTVNDSWEIMPQDRFGSRRFQAKHKTEDVRVEIWHFSEIILEPVQYGFCSWKFIDRGYYSNTETKQITGTCFPKTDNDMFVFAYIYHWGGGTWQFEIHTGMKESISGKKMGEMLLTQFIWRGDEDIPVRQP